MKALVKGEVKTRLKKLASEGTFIMKVPFRVVQIIVPKGNVTFRLVASGYRDNQDKTS